MTLVILAIRHHFTQQPFRLHSFKHKGYWFHGAKREQSTMALFAKLINPGDVVVQTRGHIGYIAVYFSHFVGDVSAFANGNHFCLHPHWHAASLQAHFGMKE
ncbi:MAG UNVERIFIED_CONTAM: hypothetical protein LVT10_13450 [Anaerolineae bacterium]|jgi:hypothetical protein